MSSSQQPDSLSFQFQSPDHLAIVATLNEAAQAAQFFRLTEPTCKKDYPYAGKGHCLGGPCPAV